MSIRASEAPYPTERRSGLQRRRAESGEPIVDVFRSDDRRLGLGRRWEDWLRRPTGAEAETAHREPGVREP